MTAAASIPAEKSADAPYIAYGAQGRLNNIVAYAYVVVDRRRVRGVEARMAMLRRRPRAPAEALHAVVRRAVRIINQERVVLRYAHADIAAWKAAYPSHDIELEHDSARSGTKLPLHMEPKGLLGTVARGCFQFPQDGSKGPPMSACQILDARDAPPAPCFELAGIAAEVVAQAAAGAGFFRAELASVRFWTGADLQPDPAVQPG